MYDSRGRRVKGSIRCVWTKLWLSCRPTHCTLHNVHNAHGRCLQPTDRLCLIPTMRSDVSMHPDNGVACIASRKATEMNCITFINKLLCVCVRKRKQFSMILYPTKARKESQFDSDIPNSKWTIEGNIDKLLWAWQRFLNAYSIVMKTII